MKKEILDKVINKATKKEVCDSYSGKYVAEVSCIVGEPLKIKFEDGSSITHENIIDLAENDYGYWIETTKKLWKFDYKYIKN